MMLIPVLSDEKTVKGCFEEANSLGKLSIR
jgi:hypothetical protein